MSISTHELPSIGGPLSLTAQLAHSRRCWLTSAPAMQGLPATRSCRRSAVRWRFTVPPNPMASSTQYTLTLHVAGIGSRVVTDQRTVTVAAQSPTCPGQTDTSLPITRAIFNDPTTGRPADQDAVVNAMINLICSTSPPANGVPASVNFAMFVDELPEVGQALIWAHDSRSANVRVILDGSNAELVDPSGVITPNPAYQDLVAGLPAGSVVLCGANAGVVPLPADGDVRRRAQATAPSTDPQVVTQAGTACAGDNILHTKLLAISSVDTAGDPAVMTSSQNLSPHSEQSAYNNALQVVGSQALYDANAAYVDQLATDTRNPTLGGDLASGPVRTGAGDVTPGFFPRNDSAAFPPDNSYDATNDRATDETAELLRDVSCTRPGRFAGSRHGATARTMVRIAMYSFGSRTLVTNRLVALATAGCDVQVVYTRMPTATRTTLVAGGITPVRLSDSAYPLPDGSTTRIFVHDKYLLISGAYNDGGTIARNQDIVQTGSQNLTQVGLHHNDDQVLQLRQTAIRGGGTTSVFSAYATNWGQLLSLAKAVRG